MYPFKFDIGDQVAHLHDKFHRVFLIVDRLVVDGDPVYELMDPFGRSYYSVHQVLLKLVQAAPDDEELEDVDSQPSELEERIVVLEKRLFALEEPNLERRLEHLEKDMYTQDAVNQLVERALERQRTELAGIDVARIVALEKAKTLVPGSLFGSPSADELIKVANFLLNAGDDEVTA